MRRMLRSLPLRFLLVIALLFAQQGAMTHGIAHTLAEQSHDKSLAHDKHCDLCAVYAQIGSAVGSSNIHFDFTATFAETLSSHASSFRSVAFAAFSARAPPYSV
jgi:hypothetical protein